MKSKLFFTAITVVALVAAEGCGEDVSTNAPTANSQEPGTAEAAILATNLEIPWSLDFLPDGNIIFTERPGRIRLYQSDGGLLSEPLLTLDDVVARGEGGLMGIALHPDFENNQYVYLYYTYNSGGNDANHVVRYIKEGNSLVENRVILDGIPAGTIHHGGRIKFGPDGYLYIGSGDAGNDQSAQDLDSLNGKILRITDEGGIPEDNPFPGSPVYSYGHRNPEGLAWDEEGRLWATEHGSSATDELNLIVPGGNYGWPVIRGNETREGMIAPVIHSGSETWAPSGAAYYNGSIFFTGLRGASLFEAVIDGDEATLQRHLQDEYGRLRAVVLGPDGFFYLLTSNRDGRGNPVAEDDRLIKIGPGELQ